MDRLWTPWRYAYITGLGEPPGQPLRKGVPRELDAWPASDTHCVFCNLIGAVTWAIGEGMAEDVAERLGFILARRQTCFLCLNAFPYASGHLMVVPYRHVDSLALLNVEEAAELISLAQQMERVLRAVYKPDGLNLGMNLGAAAGAGVAGHLHLHILPRWAGDTNFMTVLAETRVLPETLEQTFDRVRGELVTQGDLGTLQVET